MEGGSAHHFTTTDDATCAATLGAGMDNDCGGFFGGKGGSLDSAIKDGAVTKSVRESALGNLVRVQIRLGMFDADDDQPYRTYKTDRVDTPEHRSLALEAARQGMTLVKNTNGVLPLSKTKVKTVAAVGPHCNATTDMQSNYHGSAPYLVSPAEGLAKYAAVATEMGCVIGQCKGCHAKNANKDDPSPNVPPSVTNAVALAGSLDGAATLATLISRPQAGQFRGTRVLIWFPGRHLFECAKSSTTLLVVPILRTRKNNSQEISSNSCRVAYGREISVVSDQARMLDSPNSGTTHFFCCFDSDDHLHRVRWSCRRRRARQIWDRPAR